MNQMGKEISETGALSKTMAFERLRWKDDESKRGTKRRRRMSVGKESDHAEKGAQSSTDIVVTESGQHFNSCQVDRTADWQSPWYVPVEQGFEKDVEEIGRDNNRIAQYCPTSQGILPWVAPLSSQARMLFSYCKLRNVPP